MFSSTPSADHMTLALEAIFRDNSAPDLRRFSKGGVLITTGEMDVFGNFSIGVHPDELPVAAAKLADLDVPSMMIAPGDRSQAYEGIIGNFGFAHVGAIPAMTVQLDRLPDVSLPAEYTFERLKANDNGAQWAGALSAGYPVAPKAAATMSPIHARVSDADDAPLQFFQVRCGDEIAGVSALVLTNGLAGIYCVATLPEHRRKGLGAVLTALPLRVAQKLGFETGVLQSSEAGYPVYRKLGFEDSGFVQLYLRTPPGTDQGISA